MSILYISYDGMLDPLGQSQVLAYLMKLSGEREIILLSYEKTREWNDPYLRNGIAGAIQSAGIKWTPLTYHKWPSMISTVFDLLVGLFAGAWLVFRHRVRVVHARSLIPAIISLGLKKLFRVRFIYDIRGFWVDCRMEQGHLRESSLAYKTLKHLEMRCLRDADVIVSLTQKAVDAMKTFPFLKDKPPRFKVITTCTNLEMFKPAESSFSSAAPRPFTLGYVGSVGNLYMFDELLECFQVLCELRPDARLHIVNRKDHDYIRERINAHQIPREKLEIRAVEHAQVAGELQKMDAGACFVLPTPSIVAAAPTKIGEYLATGIPVIANIQSGDVGRIFEENRIGVGITEFTCTVFRDVLPKLLALAADPDIKNRCVAVAEREFSLARGVESYDRLYKEIGA